MDAALCSTSIYATVDCSIGPALLNSNVIYCHFGENSTSSNCENLSYRSPFAHLGWLSYRSPFAHLGWQAEHGGSLASWRRGVGHCDGFDDLS